MIFMFICKKGFHLHPGRDGSDGRETAGLETINARDYPGSMGPSTLATLLNHMWPRIVAGIFIPVGNHYFQALASTLQFVAQVCDSRHRQSVCIHNIHVAATCRPSVLGSATMRGHMWLNKVASVLGPYQFLKRKTKSRAIALYVFGARMRNRCLAVASVQKFRQLNLLHCNYGTFSLCTLIHKKYAKHH